MYRSLLTVLFLSAIFVIACYPVPPTPLDSPDAADEDTEPDGGSDGGVDGGPDGGFDAGPDGGDTETETGLIEGDGTCVPIAAIPVDLPLAGDTSTSLTNAMYDYSCSALTHTGPDAVYSYYHMLPATLKITAQLEAEADLDLFILETQCSQDACVAKGTSSTGSETVEHVVETGDQIFFAIDGFEGAAGQFVLTLSGVTIETLCEDSLDNDGDGTTDCDDDDCKADPTCAQICSATPIMCGQIVSQSTAGFTNQIDTYGSLLTGYTSPEAAFSFIAPSPGISVRASLWDAEPGMTLLHLSGECSTFGFSTGPHAQVDFSPLPAEEHFIVVDALGDASGSFSVSMTCNEESCGDLLDNDDDGTTDCDDMECLDQPECIDPCDPLELDAGCAQVDGGAPPVGCYMVEDSPPAGFCAQAGDAGTGDDCDDQFDCSPGMACTPASVCLPACDLSDGVPGCADGGCTSMGIDPFGVCL